MSQFSVKKKLHSVLLGSETKYIELLSFLSMNKCIVFL
jgi:hypothetical protein